MNQSTLPTATSVSPSPARRHSKRTGSEEAMLKPRDMNMDMNIEHEKEQEQEEAGPIGG